MTEIIKLYSDKVFFNILYLKRNISIKHKYILCQQADLRKIKKTETLQIIQMDSNFQLWNPFKNKKIEDITNHPFEFFLLKSFDGLDYSCIANPSSNLDIILELESFFLEIGEKKSICYKRKV